jgi:protein required for attachment to host cells
MAHTTRVLIADASRARLFEHRRDERRLDLIFEDDRPQLRDREAARDADRPGRVHERRGQVRHAMEPSTAADERGREGFASELVARLREGSEAGFDLLLVAPPAMLGTLRAQLDNELRGRVVAELDKDLTKVAPADLVDHLSDWIRIDPRPDLA